MINIASFLLTRRCNLKCDYCRISGDIDYILAPSEYKDSIYYIDNLKPPSFWIDNIDRLMKHNSQIFFILFGGEPFLYDGIIEIIKYLNDKNANYTIISNCTQNDKMNLLFAEVESIKGFTASIDPGFWKDHIDDEYFKSKCGFKYLKYLIETHKVEDPVAEITVDKYNIDDLEETVKRLSEAGITSDITVMDIAKSNYYDFSTIMETEHLVPKDEKTRKIFDNLINSPYKIHMKDSLLNRIYDILPAELNCRIEDNLHSITIDSDGTMRLCLRIRGRDVPKLKLSELLKKDGTYTNIMDTAMRVFGQDKELLCRGCNHTCYIMSQLDQLIIIKH